MIKNLNSLLLKSGLGMYKPTIVMRSPAKLYGGRRPYKKALPAIRPKSREFRRNFAADFARDTRAPRLKAAQKSHRDAARRAVPLDCFWMRVTRRARTFGAEIRAVLRSKFF